MKICPIAAAVLAIMLALLAPRMAHAQFGGPKHVTVSAAAPASAAPGKLFKITVTLQIAPTYHIQSNAAKEPYIPTTVKVTCPAGFKVGKAVFPAAKKVSVGSEKMDGFDGKVVVTVPVSSPATAKGKRGFKVTVGYQACDNSSCFPPDDASASATVVLGGAAGKKRR